MRQTFYILLISFMLFACNSNKTKHDTTATTEESSSTNEVWEDPPMLLGDFEIEALRQAPYSEWYSPIYEETVLDEERVVYLGTLLDNVEILGFIGSWCSDTQIELPNLLKTLDKVNFDKNKLKLIGVDEEYQAPDGSNLNWNIKRVPTFIFLKDNKELGRFVEFPDVSLLEDMIKILEKNQ